MIGPAVEVLVFEGAEEPFGFYFYNTIDEVDLVVSALADIVAPRVAHSAGSPATR